MELNYPFTQLKRWRFAFRVFGNNLEYSDYVKIVKHCFLRYALGRIRPVSVVFALTYRCQCSCVHCSVGGYKKRSSEELTTSQIKGLLTSISEAGIFKVTFFGGEPFLREDLFGLLEHSRRIRLRISID